jgi:hypothetical protein
MAITAVHRRCSWLEAESASGPELAKYLDRVLADRDQTAHMYGPAFARAMYAWRVEKRNSSFFYVDGLLLRLGIHPSEVPDEVWRREGTRSITLRDELGRARAR